MLLRFQGSYQDDILMKVLDMPRQKLRTERIAVVDEGNEINLLF
jgi:hypothetical protein